MTCRPVMDVCFRVLTAALLSLVIGGASAATFSGNPGAGGPPSRFSAEEIIRFAKKVERVLGEKGARVALVSRVGRPPAEMPQGMYYTHVAFAVYSDVPTRDNRVLRGYAMFNEYQNDDRPDTSALVQDYPVDFFAGVAGLEAGIIIPSPVLQQRLLDVIASPTYAALHEPRYSAIANPYTLGRQNCTEFVLDVLFAAIYQTADVQVIKANEKAFFVAQPVNVSPLKLLLGSMFTVEISLADQSDSPVTATFEKIGDFLGKYDAGVEVFTVKAD